jgi:hypothetical protein
VERRAIALVRLSIYIGGALGRIAAFLPFLRVRRGIAAAPAQIGSSWPFLAGDGYSRNACGKADVVPMPA